ncbi:protein S100-A10b [Paralichthys olivaceus]|uniref:protein S100-A10b n=1 Tax=Paralichthys olivaceus TaxID=8255 RepID=UPI00097CEFB3|nr:PREDICTED: protein S100-A1-like [Paralichthys olivaceus]
MTKLETSMECIIKVFHDYASEDKDGRTLNKKELKKLLENELPVFLKAQKNPNTVDCIMKDLDQNKDDKINFEEFVGFVAGLSNACEKCYELSQKKSKN